MDNIFLFDPENCDEENPQEGSSSDENTSQTESKHYDFPFIF